MSRSGFSFDPSNTQSLTDSDVTLLANKKGNKTITRASLEDILGGWRDLLGPLSSAKIPASSAPSWSAFGPSGGLYAYSFAVNDQLFVTYHIDHDMKQGATMYPHMHWSTDGTDTNTVKWEIEYSIASRDDDTPDTFPAPTIVNLEAAAPGTAWSHIVTEDATGVSTPEVDSLVMVKIKRVTNGGTENTDTVYGLTMDWHYPTDRYATKNRAPDFYT